MPHLALNLFGSFQAALEGQPLSGFVSRKAEALLAYLAVEAHRAHTRQELVGLLWPDYPESSARANLRSVLANVRNVIGDRHAAPPFLTITPQTIQFNPASDHRFDVDIFLQRSSSDTLDGVTIHRLEEAVSRVQGSFLAGFSMPDSPPCEEWVLLKRAMIERQISTALARLTRHYELAGKNDRALHHARCWVDMDPWQEQAQRQVMRLLVADGRRNEALAQYETCRRMLADELGVEPDEETVALYEQIQRGQLSAERPKGRRSRYAVPPPLTPLVGREAELADLSRMLDDPRLRLITLVGPGGIGKTHLAMAAAAACRQFRDGACLVQLAPLQSSDGVVPTVAAALRLSFRGEVEPQEQLLDYLRERELLLVMDNYEHLLDDVGPVVSILETAPGVKVLATSRLRLGVAGEQLLPVEGLAYPSEAEIADPNAVNTVGRHAAIALFRQYARRLRPDFSVAENNLTDVASICALLSGMPLGIVQAASWIEMLDPGEIRAEIELGFQFLQTDLHELPTRQRSLETVFEQTWKLLSAQERSTFQQLAVFRGGFTRSAALAVTRADLPDLLALVHKFLLRRTSSDRYEIHELLRQFGERKLMTSSTDDEGARDRHSVHCLELVRKWGQDLRGSRQQVVLARFDAESENIRVAWQSAIEQRNMVQLDGVMDNLGIFYEWRGRYREGEAACRKATDLENVSATPEAVRVVAQNLRWRARFNRLLGESEAAGNLIQRGLDLLNRPPADMLDVRAEKAALFFEHGQQTSDRSDAVTFGKQALAMYRTLEDRWAIARTLQFLGEYCLDYMASAEKGEQFLVESLRLYEDLGDRRGVASSFRRLGFNANLHGRAEESENYLRSSLDVFRQTDDRANIVAALSSLSSLLTNAHGRFEDAHGLLDEAMDLARELGYRRRVAGIAGMLAFVNLHRGRWQTADAAGLECLHIAREIGHPHLVSFGLWQLGDIALITANLDQADWRLQESVEIERNAGSLTRLHDVLISRGIAAHASGHSREMRQCLAEVLPGILDDRLWFSAIRILPLAALDALERGRLEMAVEVWSLALCQPHIASSTWYRAVAGRQIEAEAARLPPESRFAAQQRGKERDLWKTVDELLARFE